MNYCPTCRRTFKPRGIPAKVVAGEIGPEQAPKIAAGWNDIQHLLRLFGPLPRTRVVETLGERGLAEGTVDSIIRAARQLGFVQVDYVAEGEPIRRRAWISWAKR